MQHFKSIVRLLGRLPIAIACITAGCGEKVQEELSIPTDPAVIARGKEIFQANCSACHNFRQKAIGPNLSGVTTEADADWLFRFIRNAPEMIDGGDARAVKLYEEYQQYMPAFTSIDSSDIMAIVGYLHTHQEKPAATLARSERTGALLDPIPEKIPNANLSLVLQEVAQAPATLPEPPVARINKMLVLPNGDNERWFVHDLQGILYEIKAEQFEPYLDLAAAMTKFIDKPGLGSGFGSFAFHPEFNNNGLLYTTHTEAPGSASADYDYHDSIDVAVQWVLTEWQTDDPQANAFAGSPRELLRINMVSGVHGMQEVTFNPTAQPGDEDYGLLYQGVGDGGAVLHGHAELIQNLSGPWGSMLRIDPQGSNSRNGQYGIPDSNPYAQDDNEQTLGEVWAYGFRNPHRISWDAGGNHSMLISGIGQKNAEEVNLGVAGANYGWGEREGTFLLDTQGDIDKSYPLPDNDAELGFTYPVAQYDHDEGNAISGGFVYRGEAVPELQGKYVFGDIVTGRLFYAESDQLRLGQQADIKALGVRIDEQETDLRTATGVNRVDLRFGIGPDNELYIFTKSDGKVRRVVGLQDTAAGV